MYNLITYKRVATFHVGGIPKEKLGDVISIMLKKDGKELYSVSVRQNFDGSYSVEGDYPYINVSPFPKGDKHSEEWTEYMSECTKKRREEIDNVLHGGS